MNPIQPAPANLDRRRSALTWLGLIAASFALSGLFHVLQLPGSLLLGPMIAAIGFGVAGARARVPRPLFTTAQGVIGCLIAQTVTAAVLVEIARDWPEMAFAVTAMVGASAAIGWLLARFGTLPGSSAAWGSSPGAASVMTSMAAEYGADPRLVAFMQYVRVICVVLAASVVSRWLIAPDHHPAPLPAAGVPTAPLGLIGLAVTLMLATIGSWLGGRIRLPAGGLMMPMLLGAVLNATGVVPIVLPAWLLGGAYMAIGWYVGLQFSRETLRHTMAALPEVLLGSIGIIMLCGFSAWLLTYFGRTDALTAFLATSPGGIDSVAIIAVDGNADLPFVMALQTLRLLVVLATGPLLAKWITRSARGRD
jgi:membrane AbrB-like protein